MTHAAFADTHAAFLQTRGGVSPWLAEHRTKGFERFRANGFPTRRHEAWKYTNLKAFAEFRPSVAPVPRRAEDNAWLKTRVTPHLSSGDITLVFVDGIIDRAFSSSLPSISGVKIRSLADVSAAVDKGLECLVTAEPQAWSDHPFAALSQAFLDLGLVIEIDRDCHVQTTLHIIHVNQIPGAAVFPRTLIQLASGAQATITETFLGAPDTAYCLASRVDINLAPGASLLYTRTQIDGNLGLHAGLGYARLDRDARLYAYSHMQGGRLLRNDFAVDLNGSGADVTLDGLYLARGHEHVDNQTVINHKVAHTQSSQTYKGVLKDSSRAVFNGRVFVQQNAQQTNARQLNRNLLLSNDAEVDTKPELLIDANDVKCSHGATVGQLRRDELFYLQSRGLSYDEAVASLSAAFAEEVALKLPDANVLQRLRAFTKEWLAL